jgi:hypothetical protein
MPSEFSFYLYYVLKIHLASVINFSVMKNQRVKEFKMNMFGKTFNTMIMIIIHTSLFTAVGFINIVTQSSHLFSF